MVNKIKVAIVDDHPGVRAGLKRLLVAASDIDVVGEGADGFEAVELVQSHNPDVLLLDVEMPVRRGDDALQDVLTYQPGLKVLAVSSYHDRLYIQGMLDNGAAGYITKDEAPALLLNAVRSIARSSDRWISPKAQRTAWQSGNEELTLTTREVEILQALLRGQSLEQIANHLEINRSQVEKYLSLLKFKFNTDSLEALLRSVTGKLPPTR